MARPIRTERRRFTRGWIANAAQDSNLDAFQMPRGWWISPDEWGALESAPGRTATDNEALNVSALYSANVEGGGTENIYVQLDTKVAAITAAGVVGSDIKTGLTATLKCAFTTARGADNNEYVFVVNGEDTPFKIRVSTGVASDTGLTRPTVSSGASTALNSGGNNSVKGVVKYYIAEMSGTTEGALSVAFGSIDCEDGDRVDLTLNNAEFYGKTYRVYRTYRDGLDPWYLQTMTVAGSAPGTTITDDTADELLGDPPYAHGDPPPDGATSLLTYFNRVYALHRNELYWSDLGNPESWFTSVFGNRLTIGGDDGDQGVALARARDGIIVFKKHHMYKILGRQPREFEMIEITPSDNPGKTVGTHGTTSFAYTGNGDIIFYYQWQLYRYSGGEHVTPISGLIEDDLRTLITDGAAFDESGRWDVVLHYVPRHQRVWATINEITVFYDVRTGLWAGAMEHGYRCYLSVGQGENEALLLGGSRGITGSHDIQQIYLVNYATTLAVDHSFELYPEGGLSDLRRFLSVDSYWKNAGANRTADFSVTLDGRADAITAAAQSVNDTSSRGRIPHRLYVAAEGHDCGIKITSDSATNSTNPLTIYEVIYRYQDLEAGLGMLLTA